MGAPAPPAMRASPASDADRVTAADDRQPPMARNVEIKARADNLEALAVRASAIADGDPVEIAQDDTFFACANGRLKLRSFSDSAGELIFYRRPEDSGPKQSFYLIAPTSTPDRLRETLTLAYGQLGRVRKRRTLFLVDRTRIHLDRVEGLGDFVELEVVLRDDEPAERGIDEARALMARLGIEASALVEGAYLDLLAAGGR
jgi:predicted adenylyl cyclase CyaB